MRKKAFIGALIGAAASLIQGGINANQQNKAIARQRRARVREQSLAEANALSNAYSNQDDYNDKLEFKCGGKKRKKAEFGDRISRREKFACGGRKKAKAGTITNTDFSDRIEYRCGGKKKKK